MSTKARRKTRGDLQLEKALKDKLRSDLGLEFKGTRKYEDVPPHLQPNSLFRTFRGKRKGDSKVSAIKHPDKMPKISLKRKTR